MISARSRIAARLCSLALGLAALPLPAAATTLPGRTPDEVIDAAELQTWAMAGYEIEPALALRAGVTFLSSGDTASEDWLLVRGLPRDSSRNVLVLLDGMPINNAFTASVELHDVPVSAMQRVEIWKPPLPARYGGYHAVLNIVTRMPGSDATRVDLAGGLGLLETARAEATIHGRLGDAAFSAGVGGLRTAGLSGFRRTPPLETLTYGDRSYRDVTPTLHAAWTPGPRTRVGLVGLFSSSRKGFSDDEYRNRDFGTAGLSLGHRTEGGATVDATVYGAAEHYFLRLYMHPDIAGQDRTRLGARLDVGVPLLDGLTLRVGATADRTGLTAGDEAVSQGVAGGYAEVTWAPHERLVVDGGARVDAGEGADPAPSPSAGVTVRTWPGATVAVRAASTARWPVLGELAPDLRAERLGSVSVQATQKLGDRVEATLTGAALRLEDELAPSATTGRYENLQQNVDVRTIEGTVRFRPTPAWTWLATWTFTDAQRQGEANPLAYGPPDHMAGLSALYAGPRQSLRLAARYLGAKRGVLRHGGEVAEVADALVVDAYAARELQDGVRLFLLAENLTDRTYETFQGRPMLPRLVLLGLELTTL